MVGNILAVKESIDFCIRFDFSRIRRWVFTISFSFYSDSFAY